MRKQTERIVVPATAAPTKAKQNVILKSREGSMQPEQLHISHEKVTVSICGFEIYMN
jgi:hypothetical protein